MENLLFQSFFFYFIRLWKDLISLIFHIFTMFHNLFHVVFHDSFHSGFTFL